MRTLDDEADALRAVGEHIRKAIDAMPKRAKQDAASPSIGSWWDIIDSELDGVGASIRIALNEIGAKP